MEDSLASRAAGAADPVVARYATTGQGLAAQALIDHLQGVAALAHSFSAPFGASALGELAGLWHDLGKYAPDWQQFIRSACGVDKPGAEDAHLEDDHPRHKGPDHSAAGALHALARLGAVGPVLAQIIAAHHAGLYNGIDLHQRLTDVRINGRPDRLLAVVRAAGCANPAVARPSAGSACTDDDPR